MGFELADVSRGIQHLHRRDEAVSTLRQSLDVARVLRRVAQGLTDFVDRRTQTASKLTTVSEPQICR